MNVPERLSNLKGKVVEAKEGLIALLGALASEGDWDQAERVKTWAKSLDDLARQMGSGKATDLVATRPAPNEGLPYFYVDRDQKLVMRARSRDDGYYEHRVIKPHFDLIVRKVAQIHPIGVPFSSQELQNRNEMPVHEPLLIMRLFASKGLVRKLQKGKYVLVDGRGFESGAARLWTDLPRG
jgi:hypothetical protein